MTKQKIVPCLWFNGQAEEAANFYCSLFPDARITDMLRWGEVGHGTPGSVLTVSFEIEGQEFLALNGGPEFQFTPAISLMINCERQDEIDALWEKLGADGGEAMQCGWITDKYGMTWQVTPRRLLALLKDKDPARAGRAMQAMMGMVKLDLPAIEAAADGK
ncbi:VOC family protein [Radicibacter daui]|uniref:VOC family protein n=1 Tax=Radicibacter daui TaxID=3064829 RepID=UPI00404696E5